MAKNLSPILEIWLQAHYVSLIQKLLQNDL